MIASLFFVSNIYFSEDSGYFNAAAQNNPLLHTWSLSIEEQFYVILPIVLYGLRRFSHRNRVIALTLIVGTSLAFSIFISHAFPDTAYYSFFARAWELGIGALLAITNPKIRSRRLAEILGLAGALAILGSLTQFTKNVEFPGYAALLPTIGAAAIISSGAVSASTISRLLSLKPIRWIGIISYSLYLWHWPLLVIARLEGYDGRRETLIAVVICFILAALSWRYVEQPFRTGPVSQALSNPKTTVAVGMTCMAAMVGLSLASPTLSAFLVPGDRDAQHFADFSAAPSQGAMRRGTCFLSNRSFNIQDFRKDPCLTMDEVRPNVLLLGDSHAAQYYEAIRALNPGANIMQANASGCRPLLNTAGESRCVDLWNLVTRDFLPNTHSLDTIILGGRWEPGQAAAAFATARYLSRFAGKIVIIGPNQEFKSPLPNILARSRALNDKNMLSRNISLGPKLVDEEFKNSNAGGSNVIYVSFFKIMCEKGCPTTSTAGDPLLFDSDHLSLSASFDLVRAAGSALAFGHPL